jgi:hypothetical protein
VTTPPPPTPYWFKHPQNTVNGKIRCQSNLTGTKGKDFSLTHTLFIDNNAIVANMCEELIERGEELFHHFKKYGLLMHAGECNKKGNWIPSKSEAMFFPKKNTIYKKPDPITFSTKNTISSTPINSSTLDVYLHLICLTTLKLQCE